MNKLIFILNEKIPHCKRNNFTNSFFFKTFTTPDHNNKMKKTNYINNKG